MPQFRTGRRRDGSKYPYPITPSRSVLRNKPKMKILRPVRRRLGGSILRRILSSVLHQIPFLRELHMAYIVADTMYNNWSEIKELYEAYSRKGWSGVVDTRAVHKTASSLQTSAIWSVIRKVIPEKFQTGTLRILSTIVDKITEEEIKFVKRFLQENE